MAKNKIISLIVVFGVLAFVYWWGGDAPSVRDPETESQTSLIESTETAKTTSSEAEEKEDKNKFTQAQSDTSDKSKSKNKSGAHLTAQEKLDMSEKIANETSEIAENNKNVFGEKVVFLPEDEPPSINEADTEVSEKEYTCTLSVRCDTILNNLDWLAAEKHSLVPGDGVIFPEQTVIFYDGESVFDLLSREMRANNIHLEFATTPVYKSTYIEGIANIYEFDCGALSGWMYKVNDWYPNYGSSRYQLKENDKVEWVYTCDLGTDVGGYYGANNRTE